MTGISYYSYYKDDNTEIVITEAHVKTILEHDIFKDKIIICTVGWDVSYSDRYESYLPTTLTNNIYILSNGLLQHGLLCKHYGQDNIILCHQNSLYLNEDYYNIMDIEQIGNGICISRKCDFKRLELLSGIKEHVTLIHGPTWRHNNPYKLNVKFMQEYHDIRPKDIVVKLNRHKVGFILSDIEGGNFATSEYMLCGLPVISTPSYGGREYFFNGTNSIICDATVGAVNKAYIAALPTEWNRTKIRNDTIKIFNEDRSRFIRLTQLIFNKNNISINAEAYFNGKLLEQKDRNKRFYRYVDIM